MNLAAIVMLLADRGLSAQDVAEVVRLYTEDMAPKPRTANAERQARFRAKRSSERDPGVTDNVTSNVTDNVTGVTPPSLDKEIPPTPPKEINPTPPPVRSLTRSNVPVTPSPKAFDEFWLAYPRKVGKGAARTAFAKALGKIPTADPSRTLLDALAVAKRAWAETDAQFIPHPSTWLNQDRWEDDPTATTATGPPADLAPLPPEWLASRVKLLEDYEKSQG